MWKIQTVLYGYIKTDDIYKSILGDVKTRVDTSNHELERPLTKGKSDKISDKKKMKLTFSWKRSQRIYNYNKLILKKGKDLKVKDIMFSLKKLMRLL